MNRSANGSRSPKRRRIHRPSIRQATLILPRTGERVRRVFTLQSPSPQPTPDDGPGLQNGYPWSTPTSSGGSPSTWSRINDILLNTWSICVSPLGQGILKCSLAYLLGSMATFVPPIAAILGKNDGKHIAATVTVYFHPARSVGSMIQATMLAFIAFLYAAMISFSSMAVSAFFGNRDMMVLGHVLVLIIFCGGGLGFVGWLKQRMGNPLVNVACSLTSLAIITVLTKEGAVQAAMFSYEKVFQVLKMVLMGITASITINLLVTPSSARTELRKQLVLATDSLEDMLRTITRAFLSGEDEATMQSSFGAASSQFKKTFSKMTTTIQDSAYEHYLLGTAAEHQLMVTLMNCVEQLAQDLGGLRGATTTQFALLNQFTNNSGYKSPDIGSPLLSPFRNETSSLLSSIGDLSVIDEEPHEGSNGRVPELSVPAGPPEIFSYFIAHLGPPMKALAFTMKEILRELPFRTTPPYEIEIDHNFKDSLRDAMDLFAQARKEALDRIYDNKGLSIASSTEMAADLEEIAASCGYFSSSLQDFAEDLMLYLNAIEELQEHLEMVGGPQRSWSWLLIPGFWSMFRRRPKDELGDEEQQPLLTEEERNEQERRPTQTSEQVRKPKRTLRSRLEWHNIKSSFAGAVWKTLSFLAREDVKFAVKVGIGAILFAMWSFIPTTRPFYSHFRGEWGLLSYMLVCSMTIGASNTTGLHRFIGTCVGAVLATLAWIVADENPFVLAILGWLVSCGCFYLIIGRGKGPMGRFILLTYNLSALYAYSLAIQDEDEDDDDEGGINPEIWEIVLHRTTAVMLGCVWGILVTRFFWAISARRKMVDGVAVLWLRMGLIWKRDPLSLLQLVEGEDGITITSAAASAAASFYLDIREVLHLKRYLARLNALKASAAHEFGLRGPFPEATFTRLLDSTERMLDAFYAMKVVITKDLKASRGEAAVLQSTTEERAHLSQRISHLFSVLASSMKLEYPLNDTMPNLGHPRDRFLARLYRVWNERRGEGVLREEDFELFYAYALVTGQVSKEIEQVARDLEELYGVLQEESLKLE
ncbi:hypothetical protein P152DRAFT_483520 [Eremomyces bilateralis CBS 781.70]|uniref:Integral membrane bound transporter domain-containing protein n=1 Tax=Eremomyces bilateralis CBS 781.70 TaxID=1392243 RepID=A0A6G1FYB5_9PEZI|nr:uncharacterized protein P152DRAFT_483520 [Eremomyces bilateralis CBS 781.70]KAF1810793.1 hypothetical protein P152DRAFT_483520 [Eremomyces bilateralis CBS 781.70]